MNIHQKKNFIAQLQRRASTLLLPATAALVCANLAEMAEAVTPESEQKLVEMIRASRAGDVEMKSALAEIRIFTTDNFLMANSNPLSFFEVVNLADSDEPFIENTSKFQIDVSYIGQDGRAKRTQGVKYQEQARVDLKTLSTDDFEYFIRDIYKGDVKSPSLANVDMARDVTLKTNALLWPFIKNSIGNFGITGAKSSRVYVPSKNVIATNLPGTNLLTATGNTASTLWRKACMDAVIKYITAWGAGAFADGDFSRKIVVYIPSAHLTGFLDEITMTSQPNSKVEQIFENAGLEMDYGGYHWVLVGDNTLDPADRTAYVQLGKPVGYFFTKPGMDETFVDQTIAMRKQNRESISMNKVIGFGLPSNRKVNTCAVVYRSAS